MHSLLHQWTFERFICSKAVEMIVHGRHIIQSIPGNQ